jgi:hypothetical protein
MGIEVVTELLYCVSDGTHERRVLSLLSRST